MMMTSSSLSLVHPILAILWVGVLLTFLAAVFAPSEARPSQNTKWFGVQTLKRLSTTGRFTDRAARDHAYARRFFPLAHEWYFRNRHASMG